MILYGVSNKCGGKKPLKTTLDSKIVEEQKNSSVDKQWVLSLIRNILSGSVKRSVLLFCCGFFLFSAHPLFYSVRPSELNCVHELSNTDVFTKVHQQQSNTFMEVKKTGIFCAYLWGMGTLRDNEGKDNQHKFQWGLIILTRKSWNSCRVRDTAHSTCHIKKCDCFVVIPQVLWTPYALCQGSVKMGPPVEQTLVCLLTGCKAFEREAEQPLTKPCRVFELSVR